MDKIGTIAIPHNEYISAFHSSGISGDGINTPLGIDTNFWTPYNETLLYSGTNEVSAINLSEPASSFQRLRFQICNNNEGKQFCEFVAPSNTGQNYNILAAYGNNVNNWWAFSRWNFVGYERLEWVGKACAVNMGWGAAGGATTAAFNTSTGFDSNLWYKAPIFAVWGVNRK